MGGGNSCEVVGESICDGAIGCCVRNNGRCAMFFSSLLLSTRVAATADASPDAATATAAGFAMDRPVCASHMRDGSLCSGLAATTKC